MVARAWGRGDGGRSGKRVESFASCVFARVCVSVCACVCVHAHVGAYACTHTFMYMCMLSRVPLFVIPQTVAHQAPLSMGFPRQKYWSGLPFPPPGHLPDPRIEPTSPALQVNSLPLSHQGSPKGSVTPSEH